MYHHDYSVYREKSSMSEVSDVVMLPKIGIRWYMNIRSLWFTFCIYAAVRACDVVAARNFHVYCDIAHDNDFLADRMTYAYHKLSYRSTRRVPDRLFLRMNFLYFFFSLPHSESSFSLFSAAIQNCSKSNRLQLNLKKIKSTVTLFFCRYS